MECVTAQVKRWLNAARNEHDSSSVQKAFHVLTAACTAAEKGAGFPPSSELYILCCEESILLEQWEMAQKCVDAFHGQLTCNRMLEARALYCDAIVRAHFISEDLSWSEAVEERLHCASSIIRGITIAVEEWPREAWAVVDGIEKLWQVVAPLFQFGHFKCLIEILAFVVSLHEKLMIGGGYTFVQWVTRLAVCLRGAGRVQDGINQLHVALDSAVRMNHERLQVQLLRMLTVFSADVVSTTVGSKGKQENTKGLIHQAVQLVHLFLLGQMDMSVAKPEFISVYDRLTLVGGSNERDATSLLLAPPTPSPPPTTSSSSFSLSSSQQPSMTMQGGKNKNRIRPTVPELISDPEVIQEVLSDVVFCMAFCNDGKRCEESIQKLTSSHHVRARTFGNYAKILVSAFDAGVFDVIDAPDASYLTPAVVEFLFQSIQEIESTMDAAKRIQDGSERSYAIQVGCSLLWNFCLPLLQESTHASLQHVLNRIVKETDACSVCRHSFQVMVEYESSVAEYNEDNLSLAVRRIRKALSRGYSITYPDGTTYAPMNLSLLWLLRRCELRVSTEGSEVTSTSNSPANQDLAMFYLEQAESTTTTSKFVSLIKASFNKLPVLAVEDQPADLSPHAGIILHPTSTTASSTTSHTSSARESRESSTNTRKRASSVLAVPPPELPTLSLTRLYLQLLEACVDHLSPALLPFAKSCALSLCAIPIIADVKYSEYIFMRGHASLLLCKVLRMEHDTVSSEEEKKVIADHLFQALKNASAIEHVLQGIGRKSAWITINACLLYLDYKAPTFAAGNFHGVSEELGEMYHFFMTLLHIDFDRECRLTADLSLFYILSLLEDYVSARGGFPFPPPPPRSYDAFMDAVLRFQPQGEWKGSDAPGLASLRRALEVCTEAMHKIALPADKQHLSRLYPAIVRLLNLKSGAEPSFAHHPQELLLQCIGRLAGPTTVEEKKALLSKEVWEYLQHDPSVQLCGQVACFAMDLGDERLVLEICELAHQLFHDGKLGWGTVYVIAPVVSEKEKPSKQEKKEAPVLAATCQPNATFPKPSCLDWLFYAKLLRFQAEVLHRRSGGIHAASKEGLLLEVLKHCVNSAIAASHGPPALRNHEVVAAIQLYYRTISTLWRSGGVPNAKVLPSLKMILSPHILCHLTRTDGGEKTMGGSGGGGASNLSTTTPPGSPPGSPTASAFRPTQHTTPSASSSAANGRSLMPRMPPGGGGPSGLLQRQGRGGGMRSNGSGGGGGGQGNHHYYYYYAGDTHGGTGASGGGGGDGESGAGVQIRYDHLHEVLRTLGHMMLRACASEGLFEDGMQAIQSVLAVLPKKYHSSFMVQNVRFRCAVGLPVDSLLHDAKSDDCETASLVWMTFAQQTGDQGKAVEAWRYAVNVLTSYPFAKATCLLEMVYHVSTHGLLPLREVQLLLFSALDLIEGFDRSVNDTCVVAAEVLQPVMDERARTFPGKLIGTLTGRSLILAAMDIGEGSSLVTALRKNLPLISLKELLLAVRIVFMLFTVAPYKVGKEEGQARALAASAASSGGFGNGKAGTVIPFITKRDCALLMLHYIDCLWRLTASIVRKEMRASLASAAASSPPTPSSPSSSSSSSLSSAPLPPPLDPPKRLGGWFGFFFHETHVRLLANAAHQDLKHNTEGLQGVFFALGQFLMEENMEQYCFMLYMWTAFAAGWRYGCEDVQYEEVKRAAYLGCEVAATSCGAGYQANLYSLPDLLPHHRAALDAKLDEIKTPPKNPSTRSPSSSSSSSMSSGPAHPPPPPPPILFSPHIGSLQDVWIRKTILLASLESSASAMKKVPKIQHRCAQMEDWDNYAKCVLLHIKELWICKQYKKALELMGQEEQAGLIEKLTPNTWERWEAHKTELLMHMGSGKAIVDASALFVSTAHRLRQRFPVDTVGREVGDVLFPHLIEVYHVELLQSIGPLLLSSIGSGGLGIPSTVSAAGEQELRNFVVELCESLENSPHVRIRMAVKRCQLHLRSPLLPHPSIPTIRRMLTSLEKESAQVEGIFAQVAVTTAEMSSALCLQTTDTLLRPTQNLVEAFFLFLRGENIMSRFRIAQSILDAYRCLSLEELGIPTGGPPALEKHVMHFIRDPTKSRGPDSELEEKRWREAKWTRKMNDIDVETNNALDYYGIPRNLIGQHLSAFECRAALYQAMEVVGPPCSSSYFTISKAIVRVELRCLLERELAVDHTGILSVEERMEDLLNHRWSVCPLAEVTKVVVNKRGGVGGGSIAAGGGGGANASDKHRKAKDHHLVEWVPRIPPKEFTEADATLLHRLWEMIRDAARKFEHSQLYEGFLLLADFYTLWQRPQSAGTAVEFALAARLIGYLTELCFLMMEDTEERRAWRRVQRFLSQRPLLAYSTRFHGIRQAALDASPMLSALNLPEEWPEEVETSSAFAFADSIVLTITQVRYHPGYFFVVLRHPDGVVDSRRQRVPAGDLQELVMRYENFLEEKRQVILEETRRLGVSRQETVVTAEDMQEFGRQIYPVLQPLLQHLEESLENLASKDVTLFLCLDPLLQPLPFAYLPVFSGFTAIQRELSVVFIKRKLETKNSKSASGVLHVVDPFGDYLPSVEGLGSEGKKGNRDVHLLTSTDKRFPFSLEYLMWIIEQPTYQAVLFNMCGSLTSLLSPAAAASIKWSHIFMVVIGADAVNEASMRREQKNELTKSLRERLFGKKWLIPLILLLRGVRYIAVSTCPTTPAANDALCRRALPALSAGRSIFESSTNRHGSPGKFGREGKKMTETVKRLDLFILYGAPFSALKTK